MKIMIYKIAKNKKILNEIIENSNLYIKLYFIIKIIYNFNIEWKFM